MVVLVCYKNIFNVFKIFFMFDQLLGMIKKKMNFKYFCFKLNKKTQIKHFFIYKKYLLNTIILKDVVDVFNFFRALKSEP
jgi:hypothetical protein